MNAELEFVEEFSRFIESNRLPRMAGRVLGWLLISDPPEQSMTDLCDVLQASKSSISTTTRLLMQFGMVERIGLPGDRRDYYRAVPGFWADALENQAIAQFRGFRMLAEKGLALAEVTPGMRKGRLQELHDVYGFLEDEFPALLARWRKQAG